MTLTFSSPTHLEGETEVRGGKDVVEEKGQIICEGLEGALEKSSRQKGNLGEGLVSGRRGGKAGPVRGREWR